MDLHDEGIKNSYNLSFQLDTLYVENSGRSIVPPLGCCNTASFWNIIPLNILLLPPSPLTPGLPKTERAFLLPLLSSLFFFFCSSFFHPFRSIKVIQVWSKRSERERVVSISARSPPRRGDYDTERGKLEIINRNWVWEAVRDSFRVITEIIDYI